MIPGIRAFLQDIMVHKIPAVIGTSTDRKNIDLAFEQLGIGEFFCGAICSEDVNLGKPNPEVFLKGAEVLGLPPKNCVVFEDSLHGIEAAITGGMHGVAITTSQPADLLKKAGAHLIVDSPMELTVSELIKQFSP